MMSMTSEEEAEDDKILSDEFEPAEREDDDEEDVSEDPSDGEEDEEEDDDDDDDDDDDTDDEHSRQRPRPQLPRLSPLQQQLHFAPPFYGRPPTPLPPSPSLTSLLRPSRPTTPDASDDELLAAGASGPPVARASPKVPTYEYYGFVLYLFSSLTFLLYLLWAFLPAPLLHALGITYYPDRWWSLAVPSFLVVGLVYVYVALAAYNTEILTLPLGSVETVVDDAARVAVVDARGRIRGTGEGRGGGGGSSAGGVGAKGARVGSAGTKRAALRGERGRERERVWEAREAQTGLFPGSVSGGAMQWKDIWSHGTDAVMDIPLAGVCEVLYGQGRERTGEDDGHDYGVLS